MSEQHGQPHGNPCREGGSRTPVDIENWPTEPRGGGSYEDEESEYLVDIDTHHAILVVARSVDEAAAKALSDEDDNGRTTTVAHDVHVCVHSGISSNECDHEDEDGDGEETD